jgi:hypothetical protein
MAYGYRKRIGRIVRPGYFPQVQQHPHHLLNLLF